MSGSNSSSLAGEPPDRRKLVAILYADMMGYSRLIGLDDEGTLQRLRALRQNLIDPAIAEHGGRIIQTGGDSVLIVFDSIDGAVRCAVKVQQQVPILDAEQHPDRAIRFRIGINIGDAIADGTDLHGDAVNVAARLQAECPPGGICVTRPVRDHVRDRLNLSFEDLGALNLKNIARPVEAFVAGPSTAVPKSVERSLVHGTGEPLPLPDKPSIAVLAFTNMSGDFRAGVLFRRDFGRHYRRAFSQPLPVRHRTQLQLYLSREIRRCKTGGTRFGRPLRARRKRAPHREQSARCCPAYRCGSGNHIWAERYDRALEDVFAVQDEITSAVVTAIVPAVADAELGRILRKPPESLGAWESYQRGLWHMARANLSDSEQANELFRRAIAHDATFAPAYAALAISFLDDAATYATHSLEEASKHAIYWAHRAVALDTDSAEAQAALGASLYLSGEHISLALALDSNSSGARFERGASLISDGNHSEGRSYILDTIRLDPRSPQCAKYLSLLAGSYYFEGEYESAIEVARRSLVRYPAYPRALRWLAAALGQLGHSDDARYALCELTRVSSAALGMYLLNRGFWRPEDHEHLLDGLRKAGWQG